MTRPPWLNHGRRIRRGIEPADALATRYGGMFFVDEAVEDPRAR